MNCRRNVLTMVSCIMMLSLTACGGTGHGAAGNESDLSETESLTVSAAESTASSDIVETTDSSKTFADLFSTEGNVFNIMCPDDDFYTLVKTYDSDYTDEGAWTAQSASPEVSENDSTKTASVPAMTVDEWLGKVSGIYHASVMTGHYGSIRVNWIIAESKDAYETMLDSALFEESGGNPDTNVDLFLVDGNDLSMYLDPETDITMTASELGIRSSDLDDQYEFTHELGSDAKGAVRAFTWEVPCGVFVYRRTAAQAVFGTDNPTRVESYLNDWDTFANTAVTLKNSGYQIYSGTDASFDAYMNGSESTWTDENNTITVDRTALDWAEYSRKLCDEGCIAECERGSDEWVGGLSGTSSVFGAFLTQNEIRKWLRSTNAANDYAICRGPSAYAADGDWICVSSGSDNPKTAAKLVKKLTCDSEIMKKIASDRDMMVNSRTAVRALASDSSWSDPLMGGQNWFSVLDTAASGLSLSGQGAYDAALKQIFREDFISYIAGEEDKAAALQQFYTDALNKYPDLLTD
ncbi:MAG: extracellular solute-binding protein [Eubacteriales bacterium]|jgi:multiple sugar transport system substrate-binding protein